MTDLSLAPSRALPWQVSTAFAALMFLAVAVVLMALRPVLPIDETRYLSVAWEMWLGGSKLVPHLNGEIYTHKPPLLFWLINAVWALTGPEGFAARLVAPAFGAVAVVLTAALARALWPGDAARAGKAALILATTGLFALYGSLTMFDTLLTVATLSAMLALWQMAKAPALAPALGLGAALALGVFAKGPVILLHVMPVALLMPVWADRAHWPPARRWYGRVALALAVAVALVLVWLAPALVLGGAEYRNDVLWRQSAGRLVSSFAHGRPLWSYLVLLPLYLWPWGWSVPALAALSPRRLIATPQNRLLTIWALGAFAAFSLISGKQVHYLLPELAALALLLSGAAASQALWARLAVLIVPVGLLGAVWALHADLPPSPPLVAAALALLAGLGVVMLRARPAALALALAAPATLLMAHLLARPLLYAQHDSRPLAGLMAMHQAQGVAVLAPNYHGEFGFTGGMTAAVAVLQGDPSQWIAAHPGGALLAWSMQGDPRLELVSQQTFRDDPVWLYRVAR